MEVKVCVDFLYNIMPELKYTTERTVSFDPKKIPQTVKCPPNCQAFATYFVVEDTLTIAGKKYRMLTNKLGVKCFNFNESDPKHLSHDVQVADMLRRVKLPDISPEGPVQIVHYFACDDNVHPDFDCRRQAVVKSNMLKDLIIPENTNRFEVFDRYVYALNIGGEEVFLFTDEKINRLCYYLGRLIEVDGRTGIKWFETVDGKPGMVTRDEVLLDPNCINEKGQIVVGGHGTTL